MNIFPSDHLDNPTVIAEYLTAAFEDGDLQRAVAALHDVAHACIRHSLVAEDDQVFCRAFIEERDPSFGSVKFLLHTLSLRFEVRPAQYVTELDNG